MSLNFILIKCNLTILVTVINSDYDRILFEVSDNARKEVFGEVRTRFKDGMQV